MSILLAHKIEINPNKKQINFLKQSIGCSRFVWNMCLTEWNSAYNRGLKPDRFYMRFYLKCLKEKFPWLKNVSAHILDNVILNLVNSFKRFFKGITKRPKFKKLGKQDSFSIHSKFKFTVINRKLRIEQLKTLIPMRELIRFDGEHRQVTISVHANKWFASVLVKLYVNPFINKFPSSENQVGVDLGIKELAVLSDGTVFNKSQPLKNKLKKLAKLQKVLSKKVRGSNRYNRLKLKISKLHYYVSCKRKAILHQLTDFLTKTYKKITIEDLNVSRMLKNNQLARAIADCGFGEFRRQLEYKTKLRGNDLVIANKFFPSSKMCSHCGFIKKNLTLADRTYQCECGLKIDRDLNAAINLKNYSGHIQAGV